MEQPLQFREGLEPLRKRRRKRRRRCKKHPQEGPHSPNCRGHNTFDATQSPALVRILPQLKPVLDFLDVKGDIFTRAQIIGHLTEYIKRKALYDPADPRKVYCENDQLGEIFDCKEFSTANACELLLKNLESFPQPKSFQRPQRTLPWPSTPSTSMSTTDTCSCSESDQQSTSDQPCSSQSLLPPTPGVKRSYGTAFQATCSVVTSLASSSCGEAKNSTIQVTNEYWKHYQTVCENATDIVTDTSDDLFFLYETEEERVVRQVAESDITYTSETDVEVRVGQVQSSDEGFSVEYEPICFSDEERLVALQRLDQEVTEDSGDTEVDEGEDGGDELGNSDSCDSEIEEDDKWQCESCCERNHPMTRRCRRCWVVRRDWFLPSLNRTSSDPGRIRNEVVPAEQATVSDSASSSQIRTADAPTVPVANDPSDSTASETRDAYGRFKCLICRKEPPNGCIIHGGTGHQVCCVDCAQKLKDNKRPCPVCRKKISKVIKNFM